MKRIITFLIIIGMILSFNINVYAEGENTTEPGDTTEVGSETDPNKDGNDGSSTGDNNEEKPSDEDGNDSKSDATLKKVTIGGVNVICTDFVCKREIVDNETTSVKIVYELTNSKAIVDPKSGFTKELKEGENTFDVKVTSEDKSKTNTYNFIITKKKLSTDSTLKKLIVNGTEINLTDDELKYKTTVSYTTKKIEIEAVPTNEKAKIIDFKDNKASFDFFETSKDFKIKVQSEAGDMVTYTITVSKRSEADVTLKSLTIKNYELDFDSEVTDYELKVLKSVDKLDITAKATNKDATVKITNPKLTVGENEVKIEVSNDGNTNTYIIKVTKLNEDDKTLANLKSLTIENYEIDFKPEKYEYDLEIENENYLSIKAIAKLSEADVEITGNLDLEDGSIIKIKVTYDDEFYNVYKINIYKEGSAILKNKVSKKAVIAVIIFNIISIITIGIVQFISKNKKHNSDEVNLKRKNKENNKIDNLDDEIIDII